MNKKEIKRQIKVIFDGSASPCTCCYGFPCTSCNDEARICIERESGGKLKLGWWVNGCPHCGKQDILLHEYADVTCFECPHCFAVVAWEEILRCVNTAFKI